MRMNRLRTVVLLSCVTLACSAPTDAGRDGAIAGDAGGSGCVSDSDCDDGVDCTADTCTSATGACRHQVVPALCPAGSSCHPIRGCEMGRACAGDTDCMDDNACTVNERCDPAARTCVVDPLDGDGDGDPPRVCEGADCDDSNPAAYGGAPELCDAVDNDCDGRIDESPAGAECGSGFTCRAGACVCADSSRASCFGECVDLGSDAANCGACGRSCGEGETCVGSTCTCPPSNLCGSRCVDLRFDSMHCGACGNACPSRASCVDGTCECPGATGAACGGACTDLATDAANCGACGNACPADFACVGGACTCGSGTLCGSACVDLDSDAANCGTCGNACPTGGWGAFCRAGVCGCYDRPVEGVVCGATCVDLMRDAANCGSCGTRCPVGGNCTGGTCTCPGASGAACSGTCRDLANDAANCGACGNVCPAVANGAPTCSSGACGFTCNPGYHPCGAMCASDMDVSSCGSSCTPCPAAPPNATATCDGTACGFVCDSGYVRAGSGCTPAPPRPIAPLSTMTSTSRRPGLRWLRAAGTTGARIQICADRACASVIATTDTTAELWTPPAELPPGPVFWRGFGMVATTVGSVASPVWELFVPTRSAPVVSAYGGIPDVNADGLADVVIGASCAPGSSRPASCGAGRVYVHLGMSSGVSTTASQVLSGSSLGVVRFGVELAAAGDVNGDGYGDLVIAADGRVLVFHGTSTGIATTPATTVLAPAGSSGFGVSVTSIGDVDRDGYADVAVGATMLGSSTGTAYVYRGGPGGLAITPSTTLPAPASGPAEFGSDMAGAGDVNGDGYGDLVIAASGSGVAHVYLGSAAGLTTTPTATITGGASVHIAGDANGDGYTDVLVGDTGCYGAACNTLVPGSAYLHLGGAAGVSATPFATFTGPDGRGGRFGSAVVIASDANGDGYGDIVIGAECVTYSTASLSCGEGRAYFYTGGPSGPPTTPTVTFAVSSGANGRFGGSAANAGDVNGDGLGDLLIGASQAPTGVFGNGPGQAFLYYGSTVAIPAVPSLTLTGPDGGSSYFGRALALLSPPRRWEIRHGG